MPRTTTSRWRRLTRGCALGLAASLAVLLLAGCSVSGGQADGGSGRTVTLLTHDAWALPKSVAARFEKESGYHLRVVTNGDAGSLTNKLVLTKGEPLGDAVYGIDNTFASRAVDAGVLAPYTPAGQSAAVHRYALPGQGAKDLTPVDWGDVCVNVDDRWFAAHHLAPPRTFADLVKPRYKGLLVTPAASTSSPGFAFLLATIGKYGAHGWQGYWKKLMANGTEVVDSWDTAYEVDFTAGSGHGDRPVVVSYNSSPPYTVPKGGGRPTTSALLGTCFRQVEYAGVLAGAAHPQAAKALVAFMTQRTFQEALPENMYVFPVDAKATLPKTWARWAKPSPHPWSVSPAEITRKRSTWLREWSDLTSS